MEELRRKGYSIQNNTSEEIEERYNYLVKKYFNIFINQVTNIIQSEMLGVPDYRIAEWVEHYLISELKINGRKQSAKINDMLIELYNSMNAKTNLNTNTSFLTKQYQENLSEFTRRINSDWLIEIINELKREILRKLEYYYDPFNGVLESTNKNFYSSLENISYGLNSKLTRQAENFTEEYKEILRIEFNKNITKIVQNLENKKHADLLKKYMPFTQLFNYKFEQFNDIILAIKKNEDKIQELRYNQENQYLSNSDESLVFMTHDNIYLLLNKENDSIIAVSPKIVQISDINDNQKLELKRTEKEYIFSNNSIPISNENEIAKIISIVKNEIPGYYNILMSDTKFQDIEKKLEIEETHKIKI